MGLGKFLLDVVCVAGVSVAAPAVFPILACVNAANRVEQEMEINDARREGKQSGIKEASKIYEEKLRKQAEEFLAKEKVAKEDKEKLVQLITKYKKALDKKEAQLKEMKKLNRDAFDKIAELESDVKEMKNQYDRLSHLLCA